MKRILLGFFIMAVVFVIAYAICHNAAYSLIAVCVVLVLLPPSLDPAIQIKERQMRPECYGAYEHRLPHIHAERDCGECPFFQECFDMSPWRVGP